MSDATNNPCQHVEIVHIIDTTTPDIYWECSNPDCKERHDTADEFIATVTPEDDDEPI